MTTRVPLQLLDPSAIPVFRAGLISNTSIPTGLAAPQWFTGFSKEFDPTNSFNGTTGRFQPTVPGYERDPALICHELEHLRQIERDGRLKFAVRYLWWLCRYGYWNNPYEVEARAAGRRSVSV